MITLVAQAAAGDSLALPPPDEIGGPPLSCVIARRRSSRAFSQQPLALADLAQLLWAAQGVTEPGRGLRSAPSAGALYPLEIDAVTAEGVFRYRPASHSAARRIASDVRPALARSALSQSCVAEATCVFAIAAVSGRTRPKYGARAARYVTLEAGHAAQNVLLQACALRLAAVPVGAFDDAAVARVLQLGAAEAPLYLVAVGFPAD